MVLKIRAKRITYLLHECNNSLSTVRISAWFYLNSFAGLAANFFRPGYKLLSKFLAITILWISLVPSPIVVNLESRQYFSAG